MGRNILSDDVSGCIIQANDTFEKLPLGNRPASKKVLLSPAADAPAVFVPQVKCRLMMMEAKPVKKTFK